MTDNEIKEVLGWWSKRACKVMCPKSMTCEKCVVTIIKQALDLINRLQSKNKELDEKNVLYKGLIDRQKAEIERLTTLCTEQNEELDRLQKVRANILKVMKENISQTKSEAIKEFAERFKEKAGSIVTSCQGYEIYETKQYQISAVDFDNLVKEMTEVSENG